MSDQVVALFRIRVREDTRDRVVPVTASEYERLCLDLAGTEVGRQEIRRMWKGWIVSTLVEAARLWPLALMVIVFGLFGHATSWFSESGMHALAGQVGRMSSILRAGAVASAPIALLLSFSRHGYRDSYHSVIDYLVNVYPQSLDSTLSAEHPLMIERE